ncbi:MAG: PAS domain S-box protein [Opitutaceae bacterium]|nr:PAS domain S-box protein [Opitutaceae bacterium]
MPSAPTRILIVEDDAGLAELFDELLTKDGALCAHVESGRLCLDWLASRQADLLLIDYSLPDLLAPALVEVLRETGRLPPFIIVTGHGDERVAVAMMKLGARDYLVKDNLVLDRLPSVVKRTLQELDNERRLAASEAALRAETQRADQYFENAAVMMLVLDREGRVQRINQAGCEILGLPPAEVLGRNWFDYFIPQKNRDGVREIFHRLMAGQLDQTRHAEHPVLNRAGEERLLAWHNSLIRDDTGAITGVLGSAEDITDRHQAEAAQREHEAFRKRVFESSQMPIIVMEAHSYRYIDCNPAAVAIYHCASRAELLGHTPMDFSSPVQYDGTPAPIKARFYIERSLAEGRIVFEWLHQRADGELWDAEVHLMSFTSNDRRFLQFTLQDITERRRAAAALRHHREMLARTEHLAQIGSWEWDSSTDTVRWSAELFRLFQRNPAEGAPSFAEQAKLYLPEDMQRLKAAVAATLSQGTPYELELRGVRGDGMIRVYLASGHSEQGPDRPAVRLFGALQDITERVITLQALKESEEKFATAFRASPVPMAIRDLGTDQYVDVNDRCLALMGYVREEIVGHAPLEIGWMAPEDRERNRHALSANGIVTDRELHLRRKDGTEVICSYSTHIIQIGGRPCVLSTSIDVTERRRAEAQLHQRMEELKRSTAELQASNEELTRFNRAATDRELRMIELKQEINDLCRQAGQAPRYALGFIETRDDSPPTQAPLLA